MKFEIVHYSRKPGIEEQLLIDIARSINKKLAGILHKRGISGKMFSMTVHIMSSYQAVLFLKNGKGYSAIRENITMQIEDGFIIFYQRTPNMAILYNTERQFDIGSPTMYEDIITWMQSMMSIK